MLRQSSRFLTQKAQSKLMTSIPSTSPAQSATRHLSTTIPSSTTRPLTTSTQVTHWNNGGGKKSFSSTQHLTQNTQNTPSAQNAPNVQNFQRNSPSPRKYYYPSIALGVATAVTFTHHLNQSPQGQHSPNQHTNLEEASLAFESDSTISPSPALSPLSSSSSSHSTIESFSSFTAFESFIQSHFQTSPSTSFLSDLFSLPSLSTLIPTAHANTRVPRARNHIPKPPQGEMRADYHVYGGLSPMEFRPFRCSDISVITEDTCLYCFNLAAPSLQLNLPVSSYVLARSDIGGETVIRPYTPISNFQGELPIVVKTYPNAKMGGKFAELEVGDTMFFKGPFQTFVYEPNSFDRVTLVAGGTGVTPMMQLIDKILTNPIDRTKMHLILANKNEYNMPLAAELNEFAETYPNRLRVTHVLEKPVTNDWDGLSGHVSKELLQVSLGKPHPHQKVFVAGPQGFMKAISGQKGEDYTQGQVTGILGELGFTERDVFKF